MGRRRLCDRLPVSLNWGGALNSEGDRLGDAGPSGLDKQLHCHVAGIARHLFGCLLRSISVARSDCPCNLFPIADRLLPPRRGGKTQASVSRRLVRQYENKPI